MYYQCFIAEGMGFDATLRAIHLCKALAEWAPVVVDFEISMQSNWPGAYRLLDPDDFVFLEQAEQHRQDQQNKLMEAQKTLQTQQALLQKEGKNFAECVVALRPYLEAIKAINQVRTLYLSNSKTLFYPTPNLPVELILLDSQTMPEPKRVECYHKVFGFAGSEQLPLPNALGLPYPLRQSLHLTGYRHSAKEPPDVVMVADSDVAHCRELMVSMLDRVGKIFVLDVYHCQALFASADWPKSVIFLEWHTHNHYLDCIPPYAVSLFAAPQRAYDSQFLWDMLGRGVWPLHSFLDGASRLHAFTWNADNLSQALTRCAQGYPPQLPHLATYRSIAQKLHRHAELPPAHSLRALECDGHHIMVGFDLPSLMPLEKSDDTVLFLCMGYSLFDGEALCTLISQYQQICIDTSQNKPFLVQLYQRFPRKRLRVFEGLNQGLGTLLSETSDKRQIHVLWRRADSLDFSQKLPRAQGKKPLLLVSSGSGKPSGFTAATAKVGSCLAAHDAALGLMLNQRVEKYWLPNLSADCWEGRIYLSPLKSFLPPNIDVVDVPQLAHLMQENKIDALFNLDPMLKRLARVRGHFAQKNVPIVALLHAMNSYTCVAEIITQLLLTPLQSFDTYISPSQAGVVTLRELVDLFNQYTQARFGKQIDFKPDIVPIAYGIEHTPFQNLHKMACRKTLNLPQDALIVLSLGRLNQRDKADLLPLVLACKQLRHQFPKLQLILGGGRAGDYTETLKKYRESLQWGDGLHVIENIHHHDKKLYLGASDVFVSLGDCIQEAFGLSLIEAMSAGLPVVASSWNGYKEVVQDGDTGFLVPTTMASQNQSSAYLQASLATTQGGQAWHFDHHESVAIDVPKLIQSLQLLLGSPALRSKMGAAGRCRALSHFDLHKQAQCMCDLIEDKLAQAQHMPPTTPPKPFVDDFVHRLAEQVPLFDVSHPLRMTSNDVSAAGRIAVLDVITNSNADERKLIEKTCELLRNTSLSIQGLQQAQPESIFTPAQMSARILRAYKYGLVELC